MRRACLGLVFAVIFLVTHGVAHSVPMGQSGTADELANLDNDLILSDLNNDGIVNGLDFIQFRACYIDAGFAGCEAADIDGNQTVDLTDFGFFVAAFASRTTQSVAAPEPGTLLLVAAGCTALAVGRRRSRA